MAEPASVVEDGGLDGAGGLVGVDEMAVLAHVGLEALPDLLDLPGLKADLLGRERDVRVRGLGGGERADEVIALLRERRDELGVLEVDEVLRGLGVGELLLGVVAPAVGLGAKILHGVEGVGVAQEGRNAGGQEADGQAVDHHVAVGAPGPERLRGEERDERGGDGDAEERGGAHTVSISGRGENPGRHREQQQILRYAQDDKS